MRALRGGWVEHVWSTRKSPAEIVHRPHVACAVHARYAKACDVHVAAHISTERFLRRIVLRDDACPRADTYRDGWRHLIAARALPPKEDPRIEHQIARTVRHVVAADQREPELRINLKARVD